MSLRASGVCSLLVLVAALPCERAAAQEEPGRIDCDVEQVDLGEVLRLIAVQAGASLVVDPRVDELVSVSLRDLPWRDCVDVLARMTRCDVVERPGGVLLVTQRARLSAAFEETDVATVLRVLAAQGDERVWVDPGVSRRVSVSFDGEAWPDAVRLVAAAAGLEVAWLEGCALVGAAGVDLAPRPSLASRFPGSARVSLSPAAPSVGSLLLDLAVAAKINLIVDAAVFDDTSAVVVLRDVPSADAMDLLLELADCDVVERPGGVLQVRRRARITGDLPAAAVRDTLRLIAAYGGRSLVVSAGVTGRQPFSCRGVPVDVALALLARQAGLHLWSDGDVVVASHLPLLDPPAAPAVDAGGPVASVLSLGGALSVALTTACAPAKVSVSALDATLDVPVHAHLSGVPWRQAAAALARLAGGDVATRATPDGERLLFEGWPSSVEGRSAPARAWFELLALPGGLRVELGPEVGPAVTATLLGVAPRRAVQLTAWAGGHRVEERDGVLHVTGDGWIEPEEEPAPPPPPAVPSRGDPAADGTKREELEGQVDDLLKKVVMLAEQRQVEELIVEFTNLRRLLSDGGPLVTVVVRERLRAWNERLRDLGEVQLSIWLQVLLTEGDQRLGDMVEAIREERFGAAAEAFERLMQVVEEMRAQEREVFHRNAEALYLRGKALQDRSARFEQAARLELRVTATAPGFAALINGRLRREGDPVLAVDGSPIPELHVVAISRGVVRMRLGDTEFVRELR